MDSPCSVLILTLNEEINIEDCLQSVAWSDDVIVLDSFSEDDTVNISTKSGARVIRRKFDNWSAHQNWAVSNIHFKYPWVFYIDADERCTVELAREISQALGASYEKTAFRLRRKDFYFGRWLKHAQLYPTWLVRLFRPEKITYERLVNPVAIVDGQIGFLEEHLHHYPFSHGVGHWIARHNRYSDMEAMEALQVANKLTLSLRRLCSRDPNLRRQGLKEVFVKIPARPLLKFFYYFVLRKGFLDGHAGMTYCILQAIYEYFIVIKTRELKRKHAGLEI